jgi:hypothetical protein
VRFVKSAADFALHSTLFIEVVKEDDQGKEQVTSATAFFVGTQRDSGLEKYLVTCQHVIEGSKKVILHFLDAQENEGKVTPRIPVTLEPTDAYFRHTGNLNIDLACCNIARIEELLKSANRQPHYFLFHDGQFATAELASSFDSVEEVLYVGYPKGVYDRFNFTPLARRGITASPYRLNFDGRPCFVIDGQVYPGSSGSPVLTIRQPGNHIGGGEVQIGEQVLLLGVLLEGMRFHSHLYEKDGSFSKEDRFYEQPIGLGVVVRADQIYRLLLQEHP